MMIYFMFILFVLMGAIPFFYILGSKDSGYIGGFWDDLFGEEQYSKDFFTD